MITKNKVFITQTASISCAGGNDTELFQNICDGHIGIKQDIIYFDNATPAIGKIKSNITFNDELILQCQKVLDASNLNNFLGTLLIVASTVGGMSNTENSYFKYNDYTKIDTSKHNINSIIQILQDKFNFLDTIGFSTACTSSANAIGYGFEVLSKGIYNNVLVVGIDQLCKTTVGGFLSLGVLSSKPCKPFDKQRDGMNVAEGIACVLLQTKQQPNCVEICGVGYSSDAFHMTQPCPNGAKTAMQNALNMAQIQPNQVDYINAHGTGTIANDTSEAQAISEVFNKTTIVSSTKSITGHTLGAAGALETIISTQVILNQTIPTSSSLDEIENKDINLSLKTKKIKINYVMSNSFAFGGNNCSLIFKRVGK